MPTPAPELATSALPALCVDLDGTLVKSDTLVDSTLALARHHPAALLRIPGWLAQGKAALKQHIAATVQLDVAHLPYNRELLQFLEQQRSTGRPIYLATAADGATARRVADHLGLFTGVLASDGTINLSGNNKLAAFRQRFGDELRLHRQRPARPAPAPGLPRAHGRQSHPRTPSRPPPRQHHPCPHLQRTGLPRSKHGPKPSASTSGPRTSSSFFP